MLCVTTGLMDRLDPEELEGVIAHEMSHVAHKDVQVMTAASFLAIIAALLIRIAFYGELFGGGRGRGSNNQNTAIIMFALMAVSIVVYAVSFLLIRMLSRYRELAADRSGALLTGQPSALKSALIKVSRRTWPRSRPRTCAPREPLNAFFFAPAMNLNAKASLSTIFSTHPSLERRLAELDKVQQQLGRTGGVGRSVGFLDTLLGRTKPVQPKLDDLFALPSAAVTLDAGAGFKPTGSGSVCFRPVEGRSFTDVQKDVQELLDLSSGKEGGLPVEVTKDSYGFNWLVSSHMSDELEALVTDLHAVNSSLVDNGFGPQLLCTLVAFTRRPGAQARPDLPVQAGHVLPVRPAVRRAPGQCARAAGQGRDRQRPEVRAGSVPLVSGLGRTRLCERVVSHASRGWLECGRTAYRWDCTLGQRQRRSARGT